MKHIHKVFILVITLMMMVTVVATQVAAQDIVTDVVPDGVKLQHFVVADGVSNSVFSIQESKPNPVEGCNSPAVYFKDSRSNNTVWVFNCSYSGLGNIIANTPAIRIVGALQNSYNDVWPNSYYDESITLSPSKLVLVRRMQLGNTHVREGSIYYDTESPITIYPSYNGLTSALVIPEKGHSISRTYLIGIIKRLGAKLTR